MQVKSFIISRFDYCNILYSCATKNLLNKLKKVLNACIRFIFNIPNYCIVALLYCRIYNSVISYLLNFVLSVSFVSLCSKSWITLLLYTFFLCFIYTYHLMKISGLLPIVINLLMFVIVTIQFLLKCVLYGIGCLELCINVLRYVILRKVSKLIILNWLSMCDSFALCLFACLLSELLNVLCNAFWFLVYRSKILCTNSLLNIRAAYKYCDIIIYYY